MAWVCGWPVMVYDVSLSPSLFHWSVRCGCHNSFIAAQTRLVIVCDYCNCSTIILSLDCYCAVCTIHFDSFLSSIVGPVSRWCQSVGAFVFSFSSINECLRNEASEREKENVAHIIEWAYGARTLWTLFHSECPSTKRKTKFEIVSFFYFHLRFIVFVRSVWLFGPD